MSLNPTFSSVEASAKLSININAFNGNTTNFPRPKNINAPVQPATAPSRSSRPLIPNMMTPM